MYRILTVAGISLLTVATAAAQAPRLAPGDTVRLTLTDGKAVYQFGGIRGDTLLARAGTESLAIPLGRVDLVEVGEHRPGGGMRVVEFGVKFLLAGAGLGVMAFLTMDRIFGGDLPDCDEAEFLQWCQDPDEHRKALIRTAVWGGLAGAAWGVYEGAKDYWVWTPLERNQLRAGLGARPTGLALGVQWRH